MAAVHPAGREPMMTTFSGMGPWSVVRVPWRVGPSAVLNILMARSRTATAARRQEPTTPDFAMQRLTDLREILRYVPHFRDKVFVIALDGAVVADENLANLLLDIALLRSLN